MAAKANNSAKQDWVRNYSSKTLDHNHLSLLQKGAGFAISPTSIPIDEYIVSTELACAKISKGAASALRAEISDILTKSKTPKSNLTKEERIAMEDLQKDESIVMDKKDYICKMEEKLNDSKTYNSTIRIQNEISAKLVELKDSNEIDAALYRKLLPNQTQIPRMFGQPKVHKGEPIPFREIVDASGGVTKGVNSFIAKLIKLLAGKTEHFVKNTQHYVESVKDITVDITLVSYDITALYLSVPQDGAIKFMRN